VKPAATAEMMKQFNMPNEISRLIPMVKNNVSVTSEIKKDHHHHRKGLSLCNLKNRPTKL
jgi:hypothetical protein